VNPRAAGYRLWQAVRWRRARLAWRFGSPGPIAGPAALGERYDVCVIGSGPAGAVLALDLARRRHRVLVVEAGPRRPRAAGGAGEARTGYPVEESRCRGLGGTSNRWFGACPRLHPLDFEPNAYTPPGAAWPIRYADLAPYYEHAESSLHVRADPLSAFHPPGRSDLPALPDPRAGALATRLAAVGIRADPPPVATGAGGADRFRVSRDLLPRLTRTAGVAVVASAEVLRLVGDGAGDVAARVRGADGVIRTTRAGIHVVAAGGLETPRLLLLSRGPDAPGGLADASGLVGRFFMDHAKVRFRGRLRDGLPRSAGRSYQFYEPFKRESLGSVILGFDAAGGPGRATLDVSADVELAPSGANRVALVTTADPGRDPGLAVHLVLAEPDRRTLDRVRTLIRRIYADLGARDVVELPGAHGEISWLFHHLGTCRMGGDPARAVVDADLRVHGTSSLYVLGSSVFVTGGAANPTLTIVALAHRLADHLDARLTTATPRPPGRPGTD
jgi:choline dehydrogenase-like flavoprotein